MASFCKQGHRFGRLQPLFSLCLKPGKLAALVWLISASISQTLSQFLLTFKKQTLSSSAYCKVQYQFTQSLADRAGYETAPILTRGPVILRMWYSSSLWAWGTLCCTHLQQKSLSLDRSMSAGSDAAGFSTEVSLLSVHVSLIPSRHRMCQCCVKYFNTSKFN